MRLRRFDGFVGAGLRESSASSSLIVGRLPRRFLGRDSTSLVSQPATPIGLWMSRRAYSAISRFLSRQRIRPRVGLERLHFPDANEFQVRTREVPVGLAPTEP